MLTTRAIASHEAVISEAERADPEVYDRRYRTKRREANFLAPDILRTEEGFLMKEGKLVGLCGGKGRAGKYKAFPNRNGLTKLSGRGSRARFSIKRQVGVDQNGKPLREQFIVVLRQRR
jgi:hypothetical protein